MRGRQSNLRFDLFSCHDDRPRFLMFTQYLIHVAGQRGSPIFYAGLFIDAPTKRAANDVFVGAQPFRFALKLIDAPTK